jgi:hypothetical protein
MDDMGIQLYLYYEWLILIKGITLKQLCNMNDSEWEEVKNEYEQYIAPTIVK